MAFVKVVVVCFIAVLIADLVAAQSCPQTITFSPCLTNVGNTGTPPAYDSQCCKLVRDPKWTDQCLCAVVSSHFPGVDETKALNLAHDCGRRVPKGIYCDGRPVPP
ncbi:protein MpLTP-like71 [Marchantia polymorpha subsp. ruderalis]|uniref:Bifunctional inhibitor/plant lipid transfer protein/seed storage helical domain-containing protein n=3 Tax=Marchantia polymorpha TaxID=3197 RepID=A0AAF6BFB5_MARPO|nr:hypothetical protein MARPO_0027s0053 [Marchantia polymorpha]BBN10699.1 hypothetical protein Mp_5g05720 [Marchantia polymorpha subsp. ruderalis]|eukprot:PTQ42933.1 hypothetical protein MARPO_0027s0053 [Marchantia polymorpha]